MKAVKWIAIVVGGLIVLVIVALLVIPMFVDVEKYKPQIEQMVTDSTGRPFRLGGDLNLSLFPWAGVALSDVHLGNPPAFEEKDFVSVKTFEVRVKLLPLLSKQVEVKKFVLDSPRIVLIRSKDGKGNWEGLGKSKAAPEEKPKAPEEQEPSQLPIRSLVVGEFLVSNGSVLWIDRTTGTEREIQDLRLELENVSLEEPIQVALSAALDGRPVSLTGTVGPVGKEPGKGAMPIDLQLAALEEMNVELEGTIQNAASDPSFDLGLNVSTFSPRKLMAKLEQPFPVETSDSKALDAVALSGKIKGSPRNVSVTEGSMELDESKITFSLVAKEFDRPNLAFDLNVDTIDLDRYLPPPGEEKSAKEEKAPSEPKKTDYAPLRRMVLDGKIQIGNLKVKGAKVQDLEMKISARDGLFRMDPLALNMYEGSVAGKGTFDVRTDTPRNAATLDAKGIQVNPLMNDVLQKDFLEGKFLADLEITLEGDDPQMMKKTLNGGGELVFTDGAIKGVNLTDMAQNVKSAFGAAQGGEKKARTDFSELRAPFTASNGVVQTPGTTMVTPLMRLEAAGEADLVQETLDFRVEPKGVATLKGKGDTKERTGVMVPIRVTGTFASPKFRPDMEGVAKEQLQKQMEGVLKGKEGEEAAPGGEAVKDLMKKLPFGK